MTRGTGNEIVLDCDWSKFSRTKFKGSIQMVRFVEISQDFSLAKHFVIYLKTSFATPVMEASELECCLTVESLNSNGVVTKRRTYKNITVVLGRDEFRDIALRIVSSQSPLGKTFLLKELTIHKRFLQEGKATIKLLTQKIQIMFSNCPPNQLAAFLKCLSLKLTQSKQNGLASNRKRLLSDKARSFENISPLTDKDFTMGCKKRPLDENNGVTPKRIKTGGKENTSSQDNNCAPRKRLNCLSSFQMNLIPEQMAVVNAIRAGRSVFFTGSAGTGKSYLLKRLITMLPPQGTFVTASNGAAACHIGGTTLHAFAGIGSGSAPLNQCVELASRPGRAQQWRRCKHLIIDEISMVDSTYFEKLDAVARAVRKKELPFGGIQLILSGDFLQLPPVTKQPATKKFCFQAESWSDCVDTTIELKHVFRQKDPLFISILQNVRVGSCSDALVSKLTETKNQTIERDGILATKLCTHKENVNQINEIHLSRLPGDKKVFEASDSDSGMCAMLDSHVPVGKTLELKEGAQVMLAKNLNVSKGLVNGARGIIKGFESGSAGYPIVKFVSGLEEVIGPEKWVVKTPGGGTVTRRQLPLKLAWAVSIHKSQGMTLDCVEISLSRVFEYGQAYVALSRARSLKGLRVLDFDSKCVRAHPDVLRYYAKLQRNSKHFNCQNEDKENIQPL